MSAVQVLLHLRMLELASMMLVFYWLIFHFPPSRLRTIRLSLALLFLVINIAAVIIAVGWAKVTLW